MDPKHEYIWSESHVICLFPFKHVVGCSATVIIMSEPAVQAEDPQLVNGVSGEEAEKSVDDGKSSQKKSAKHDSGAADLEKVTDYAEETEISSKDIAGVSGSGFDTTINSYSYRL